MSLYTPPFTASLSVNLLKAMSTYVLNKYVFYGNPCLATCCQYKRASPATTTMLATFPRSSILVLGPNSKGVPKTERPTAPTSVLRRRRRPQSFVPAYTTTNPSPRRSHKGELGWSGNIHHINSTSQLQGANKGATNSHILLSITQRCCGQEVGARCRQSGDQCSA